jgi:hypothetical protein
MTHADRRIISLMFELLIRGIFILISGLSGSKIKSQLELDYIAFREEGKKWRNLP